VGVPGSELQREAPVDGFDTNVRPPLAAARIRRTLLLNGEERKRESAAGNQPHGDECLGFRVWASTIMRNELQ
jgi:hypothetical protein